MRAVATSSTKFSPRLLAGIFMLVLKFLTFALKQGACVYASVVLETMCLMQMRVRMLNIVLNKTSRQCQSGGTTNELLQSSNKRQR